MTFETRIRRGVLRLHAPDTRWIHTGWNGGESRGDAAYSISVPDGWDCDDVGPYVTDRLAVAGYERDGPVLLTGVDVRHARGARYGPVEAIATAGISNPATLPMEPIEGATVPHGGGSRTSGTVNLAVVTARNLVEGALANLIAVAAEAKSATLLAETGFTGTTTDAIVVGCDPTGEVAHFSGSATEVGAATRACVREAVRASLTSRYDGTRPPKSVSAAEHGVSTTERAEVFVP